MCILEGISCGSAMAISAQAAQHFKDEDKTYLDEVFDQQDEAIFRK